MAHASEIYKKLTPDQYLKKVLETNIKERLRANVQDDLPHVYDKYGVLLFQIALKRITQGDAIGMMMAVTNLGENVAAKFLSETGFKKVVTTSKYGYNSPFGQCITWIADWWQDVVPILNNVPSWDEQKGLSAETLAKIGFEKETKK